MAPSPVSPGDLRPGELVFIVGTTDVAPGRIASYYSLRWGLAA